MSWVAVRTSPNKEKAVRAALKRIGHTVYLPAEVRRSRARKTGPRRRIIVPMFPGYLFIEAPSVYLESLFLHSIRETKNVKRFVTAADGAPCEIADWKIDRLRATIKDHHRLDAERKANTRIRKGIKAKVRSGALAGKSGNVTYVRGNKAKLLAWVLGAPREIEIDARELEVA